MAFRIAVRRRRTSVDQQSKQRQEKGHTKRKKDDDEGTGGGNGAPHADFPPELLTQANAALEAEKQSVEKGIDAWKKVVAAAPSSWPPRRELARVYKKAER